MHIINPQVDLLSNHDVLARLNEIKAEYDGSDGTGREREQPKGLRNVLKDTIAYITTADQEHALVPVTTTHPNRHKTLYKGSHALMHKLVNKYRLNKTEVLQLYNLRPTTQVEMLLIIEESPTRFTDEELDDMLAIIREAFEQDEKDIPEGAEHVVTPKVPARNKLEGASKKRRKGAGRK